MQGCSNFPGNEDHAVLDAKVAGMMGDIFENAKENALKIGDLLEMSWKMMFDSHLLRLAQGIQDNGAQKAKEMGYVMDAAWEITIEENPSDPESIQFSKGFVKGLTESIVFMLEAAEGMVSITAEDLQVFFTESWELMQDINEMVDLIGFSAFVSELSALAEIEIDLAKISQYTGQQIVNLEDLSRSERQQPLRSGLPHRRTLWPAEETG